MCEVFINLPIMPHEVPRLREMVGWEGRHSDYPKLFERCSFWAGCRNQSGELIAFGYIASMSLQHGYMEDIIVHPEYQGRAIGRNLVGKLLEEAARVGLEIVTLTYEPKLAAFYSGCGFSLCGGGMWKNPEK